MTSASDQGQITFDTVTVPNLSAAQLIELAAFSLNDAGIPFTYLHPGYRDWDFLLNERGRTFRVFTRNFGKDWWNEEAQRWQRTMGTDGNVAALITWMMKQKPRGRWFTSTPNDDARLFHTSDGNRCVPSFVLGDKTRALGLYSSRHGARTLSISFREV